MPSEVCRYGCRLAELSGAIRRLEREIEKRDAAIFELREQARRGVRPSERVVEATDEPVKTKVTKRRRTKKDLVEETK